MDRATLYLAPHARREIASPRAIAHCDGRTNLAKWQRHSGTAGDGSARIDAIIADHAVGAGSGTISPCGVRCGSALFLRPCLVARLGVVLLPEVSWN